jgi:hypothetical protein
LNRWNAAFKTMQRNLYHRGLSYSLIGSLLFFVFGLGCGNLADISPVDCCKSGSLCQHEAKNPADAEKCCQKTRQSIPKMCAQADAELAKKTLESAWQEPTPFESWSDGIGLWLQDNPSLTLFKPPPLELYKLTSAFLI